jgi:hypothetical protein
VASAGFLCLAAGWLVSNSMALFYINKKDILNHRRWMIRSYAFTFSATSFRLCLLGGALARIPFGPLSPLFDLSHVAIADAI